ncbi:hypothetical protein, partial [Candidatus Phytoplasma pruni]
NHIKDYRPQSHNRTNKTTYHHLRTRSGRKITSAERQQAHHDYKDAQQAYQQALQMYQSVEQTVIKRRKKKKTILWSSILITTILILITILYKR